MNEQMTQYKRDNNMKQTDHGVIVVNCRYETKYWRSRVVCCMLVSVQIPFYNKISIRNLVGWIKEDFPTLGRYIDSNFYVSSLHKIDVELLSIDRGRPNKRGDAPMIVTVMVSAISLSTLADIDIDMVQALIDEAYERVEGGEEDCTPEHEVFVRTPQYRDRTKPIGL